ncbi:MAG: lytic transglycosylase domain-containing protein [Microthrixaceae bacterium]
MTALPTVTASARTGEARRTVERAPLATSTLARPSPTLAGLPRISLDLAEVRVDSPAFRRERRRYDELAGALTSAQRERVGVDRALAALNAKAAYAQSTLAALRAQAAVLGSRLAVVDAAIADLAVGLYTSGGASARIDSALATEQPSINDADRRDVLGTASLDVLLAERAAITARLQEARERATVARRARAELSEQRVHLDEARPAALDAEVAAAPAVAAQRAQYEQARTLANVERVGFPLVALDAYHRAERSSAVASPSCGVRWWAIAGISRVEGHHGSYGGASLGERGDTTRRIIGIQLNGTNQTQVVLDSDGGTLDGDRDYDRAVGPMQFIPQTWARFAADGNEDGTSSPFNLYDATLAAARYLCRASDHLDADPGLRAAYFAYNHSELYVDRVLSFARQYERSLDLATPAD